MDQIVKTSVQVTNHITLKRKLMEEAKIGKADASALAHILSFNINNDQRKKLVSYLRESID